MDRLVRLPDLTGDASDDDAPGCAVGALVAVHLEGRPLAERGEELGPCARPEDDAPVVDDVVDGEDVREPDDDDSQSTDDGLTKQLPAGSKRKNLGRCSLRCKRPSASSTAHRRQGRAARPWATRLRPHRISPPWCSHQGGVLADDGLVAPPVTQSEPGTGCVEGEHHADDRVGQVVVHERVG